MTSFKTYRQEVFNSPLDFRLLVAEIVTPLTQVDSINIDDSRADVYAQRARGIIESKLGEIINDVSALETTPYAGPVVKKKAEYDEDSTDENTGTGTLYGVTVNSTAYTESWTITFTSTTEYSIVGSSSGPQGSGAVGTDFTATDGDIAIPSAAWSTTHATGDKFYFSSYKHLASIVTISTMLSCALYFMGAEAGVKGSESIGERLYKAALSLLNRMVDTNSIIGVDLSLDTSDLGVAWIIDTAGYDATDYGTADVQTDPGLIYQRGVPYYD